jgi:hypothetical protein
MTQANSVNSNKQHLINLEMEVLRKEIELLDRMILTKQQKLHSLQTMYQTHRQGPVYSRGSTLPKGMHEVVREGARAHQAT